MTPDDLWSKTGFVPPKAFLFSGTVSRNPRYAHEEATDPALWHPLHPPPGPEFLARTLGWLASPTPHRATRPSAAAPVPAPPATPPPGAACSPPSASRPGAAASPGWL